MSIWKYRENKKSCRNSF